MELQIGNSCQIEWYEYVVYDYIVETNYPCLFLTPKQDVPDRSHIQKRIKILINKCDLEAQKECTERFIYGYDGGVFQGAWNNIFFKVFIADRVVLIDAPNVDEAYLFILNMPVALIAAYDGKLVLHCSCVKDGNRLIGFSGGKGVGKSTICSMLATNHKKIFSDDTICIDSNSMYIFSNYTVEKYTMDTINGLRALSKDLQIPAFTYRQKYIKKLHCFQALEKFENLSIEYLFRGQSFSRVRVLEKNARIELFRNNIVGYKYANKELKAIIDTNITRIFELKDLISYILYVPYCNVNSPREFLFEIEKLVLAK